MDVLILPYNISIARVPMRRTDRKVHTSANNAKERKFAKAAQRHPKGWRQGRLPEYPRDIFFADDFIETMVSLGGKERAHQLLYYRVYPASIHFPHGKIAAQQTTMEI